MLLARERVQQMKEEKKKQIEQKFAQLDEKTEKVRALGLGRPVPSWGPSRSDVGAQELRGDPSGSYGFVALDPFPVRHRGPGVGSEPGLGRKVSALDLSAALCGGGVGVGPCPRAGLASRRPLPWVMRNMLGLQGHGVPAQSSAPQSAGLSEEGFSNGHMWVGSAGQGGAIG